MEAGVRLGWELNPKNRILTVYRPGRRPQELTQEDTLPGEDVLPGFSFTLRSLFEEKGGS